MEYKEMKQKLQNLETENKRLEDENASLWFLLDEFEKSNISNPEYRELFTKVYDKLRFQSLMTITSDGEA
jgi:DNA repair ATPase RecN|tara:strand:+ start:2546 stop:2755 length:210 start_codon:yes stop_codon:yes gene_type:complete